LLKFGLPIFLAPISNSNGYPSLMELSPYLLSQPGEYNLLILQYKMA